MVLSKRLKKTLIVISAATVIFVVVLLLCLAPIAKYLVEKYDDKFLGRKIELSWMYVNPFTGGVYIRDVKVYNNKGDSLFFTAESISVDFSMLKILNKTYEISFITVHKPWGRIINHGKEVDFKDIIAFYRHKPGYIPDPNKERLHFNILNCKIEDGEFHYLDPVIPVVYFIKHVNIESPGHWWNVDSMVFKMALQSGPEKGTLQAGFAINFKSLAYRFNANIDTFDLRPLSQYMRQLSNYGDFSGELNARVNCDGSFKNKMNLRTRGLIGINQFQFGPNLVEDYGSFQRLVLDIEDADPAGKRYRIDSVMLDRPYFRYERYDSLDNFTRMFVKDTAHKGLRTAEAKADFNLILKIAEYLAELFRNFEQSDYKINKFTVHKGNVVFNDFSLREKFMIDAMPVHLRFDSIEKNKGWVKCRLSLIMRPFGEIGVKVSLDPKNYGNFNINYQIQKVPVSLFNPYLVTYTSFPLDRGTMELSGDWQAKDSFITSTNHLVIMDPRVGRRIKRNDTRWLPLPLIMSIARERGEVIDYEIPVGGNLKSPVFDFTDVILDVLRNIFVKPPSTPYLAHVKKQGNIVDKMLTLQWQHMQNELRPKQQNFVNLMSKFMKNNPGFRITVSQQVYTVREEEHIAFFEGKKKYFMSTSGKGRKMTEDDSIDIEQLSAKDINFVRYLDKQVGDTMLFSIEQKCRFILGDSFIAMKLQRLNRERRRVFMTVFEQNGTAAQINFIAPENGVPYNGFSQFKIDYNGNVPDKLRNAYEEMNVLNDGGPRKKVGKKRWMPKVEGLTKK